MCILEKNGLSSLNGDKNIMFHCHVCGSNSAKEERVSEVFVVQGRRILVEDISASVCLRCGESTFTRQTTEQVRRMLNGEAKPVRSEEVDVFEYV